MKKLVAAFITLALATGAVFAQNSSIQDPDASNIGNDSARQALREVSVDRFEREGAWNVRISPDFGVISGRLFEGSPAGKEELKDTDNTEMEDSKVLGVKVEFFKRGVNSFYITCARPIPIEGITKTVSVWVCGRNMAHQLWLLVSLFHVVTLIFLENSADFGDVLCFGERQHQEDPGFLRIQGIAGKDIGGNLAVKCHDAVMDA